MSLFRPVLLGLVALSLGAGCQSPSSPDESDPPQDTAQSVFPDRYATLPLDTDVRDLSADQKEIVTLLIEAAQSMDAVFWEQAYGNRDSLLQTLPDSQRQRIVEVNYGPWDRLNDNAPLVDDVGSKPPGANFYPEDMTREEFEKAAATDEALDDRYTMVRRLPDGSLTAIPYHKFFVSPLTTAADLLTEAAALTENEGLADYLTLHGEALTTGDYQSTIRAWADLSSNQIDLVLGPITREEDELLGYKAAAEAIVLRRNRGWDRRLDRYTERLPDMQQALPVPDAYRQDAPGRDVDLGVYDVLYLAGHANAGPKRTARTLPTDEMGRAETDSRRLLFQNVMQDTFDELLTPVADTLLAAEQRRHLTFDAFFATQMGHELAHGLGPSHTINAQRPVPEVLPDHYRITEEAKADALSLSVADTLAAGAEMDPAPLEMYTAYLAGLFHSLRLDTDGPAARARLLQFNYLQERGAVVRDPDAGTYAVNPDSMGPATDALARDLLTLQGDGDNEAAAQFVEQYGAVPSSLQADLERLATTSIPRALIYEQGPSVLRGLEPAMATR